MKAEIIYLFYLGIEPVVIAKRLGVKTVYVNETINWYLKPIMKDDFEIYESAMNY